MNSADFRFLKMIFWYSLHQLISKPTAAIDRFHQYALGKFLKAKLEAGIISDSKDNPPDPETESKENT